MMVKRVMCYSIPLPGRGRGVRSTKGEPGFRPDKASMVQGAALGLRPRGQGGGLWVTPGHMRGEEG